VLLDEGRGREAADLFGRVLLQDPGHAGARRGLARSRILTIENERSLAARLDEGRRAADSGDPARARALLEEVVERGGDRDRALALLDRLDSRCGVLTSGTPHDQEASARTAPAPGRRRSPWPRAALATTCMVAFALLAAGVASSWGRLLDRLERRPSPSSHVAPPATQVPPASPGERALMEARRLLEQGDVAAALAALDQVSPQEPAYPFARQLRHKAEAALKRGGPAR